jgi:hypothetical protein
MIRRLGLGVLLVLGLAWCAAASDSLSVYVQTEAGFVQVALGDFPLIEGTVAYEGPAAADGQANWKSAYTYKGVSVAAILASVSGLASYETLGVVAVDGWYKMLPAAVIGGDTAAGTPILAIERDGQSGEDWEDAPVLIFLPEDEGFSNQDMLDALGAEFAHYFGDQPSTTGLMVKGVSYLVPNYDGGSLPLQPELVSQDTATAPEGVVLTVVRGDDTFTYTMDEIEALDTITAPGTFTNSASVDYTATYTGVPLTTLIGNVAGDVTILVTASDGYSMNYPAEMFQDTSEGTWILAYKENGAYMPLDPGYLRVVQVNSEGVHFSSSLSARMVTRIEVLGSYEPYSLGVIGAVDRVLTRGELEAGVGCPCHTSTVSVTSKGVTSEYSGLPLWRLIAYVDDETFPSLEQGIHYEDSDFNDGLASTAYAIDLIASDGYTQTVTSDLIAHDDRFIVAFKKDGVFLDPDSDGYMRFVFDDSVELPADMNLRSVKFLSEILLHL